MTFWADISAILVNDVMQGLNLVIIVYMLLYFTRKHVLPLIPKWIEDYRKIVIDKEALRFATGRTKLA